MTSIDFYFNAGDRLGVACRLAGKALQQKKRVLIYAPQADLAQKIDRLLWVSNATSFIPHCYAHDPLAAATPVLIASDDAPQAAACEVLLNLSPEESLESTRIWSAVGRLPASQPLLLTRPFRSPHHTISEAGLVGGGSTPQPGEISLAHNGVLFLDELPEFNRRTLEVMRQPLEDRCVTISRAIGSVTFPASLMLVAAMNPCPCGFRGDPKRNCNCSPMQVERYLSRISGPLLDRIDIHVEVPPVPFRELSNDKVGTNSDSMRDSVIGARERQKERFRETPGALNGTMSPRQIRTVCKLGSDAESLLKAAMEEMGLTARAHDKILRVSRTIADLEGSEDISAIHLSEAIGYRTLDRVYWAG